MPKTSKKTISATTVLVGTYRKEQLQKWILPKGLYNYAIHDGDTAIRDAAPEVSELWLYAGKEGKRCFSATFECEVSANELDALGYPRRKGKPHADRYLLFKIEPMSKVEVSRGEVRGKDREEPRARVLVRLSDFKHSANVAEIREQLNASNQKSSASYFDFLPDDLIKDSFENLCFCEEALQLDFYDCFKKPYIVKAPVKHAFVDLFAGCGGLSLGLEEAGFTPVLVNELNSDAMATYLANRIEDFPWLQNNNVNNVKDLVLKPELLQSFIDRIRDELGVDAEAGELDLVCGGPPCQGFSGIGFRRSYSVDKDQLPSNYLYQDMAFLVNRLNPKIFLFENVRGLLLFRT